MPTTPSVVERQNVDIDVSQGIDESVSEHVIDWTKHLLECENFQPDGEGGSLHMRPGLASTATLTASTGIRVANLKNSLQAVQTMFGQSFISQLVGSAGAASFNSPARLGASGGALIGTSNSSIPAHTVKRIPIGSGVMPHVSGVCNLTKYVVVSLVNGYDGGEGIFTSNIVFVDTASLQIARTYTLKGSVSVVGVDDRYVHVYRQTNTLTGNSGLSAFNCGMAVIDTSSALSTATAGGLTFTALPGTANHTYVIALAAISGNSIALTYDDTSGVYAGGVLHKRSNANASVTTTATGLTSSYDMDVDGTGNIYVVGISTTASFNPNTLTLTGWWRSYPGTSPWAGTASAGTSGSNAISEATNPPAAGTALNALPTALYNGTSSKMTGAALSTFITTTAYSGWILMKIGTIGTATPTGGDGELLADSIGVWGAGTRNSGGNKIFFQHFDSAWRSVEIACTTGTYFLFQYKLDAGTLKARTDSNTWTSGSTGVLAAAALTGTFQLGWSRSGFAKFFNGTIAEAGVCATTLTDPDFDNIKSYINTRYGLAL